MLSIIKKILLILLILLAAIICFLFVGKAKPAENIRWGVVFSQKHSADLGLDWRENYSAILDDLGTTHLKVVAYWDLIEPEKGDYNFSDLDWQIQEAEKRGVEILLVIGRKVPRWPECHLPTWAESLNTEELKREVLGYLEVLVLRYRNSLSVKMWQVENEPLYPYGECELLGDDFLGQEIALVRDLDDRPVVISDSGEFSLWLEAAKMGDILGFTLYKRVWSPELKIHIYYPFPAVYYHRKAWLVEKIFNKDSICVELQAEPWSEVLLYDSTLEEQRKTMDIDKFKAIIQYARNTGEDAFYLWGSEWWYWLKKRTGDLQIWEEAKKLWQ